MRLLEIPPVGAVVDIGDERDVELMGVLHLALDECSERIEFGLGGLKQEFVMYL